MCGFVGFWDFKNRSSIEEIDRSLQRMSVQIISRGPDDYGYWRDASVGLGMAHRRLAIIDLTKHGAQPMTTHDRRYVLIYNGEIYNFSELRSELEQEGASFLGHSDTEVLLQACRIWGTERTIKRLIGMFSFVLWDSHEKILTLVRDRLGIKPLYFGFMDDCLFFASQPKAFFGHRLWKPAINMDAVSAFLQLQRIPSGMSIYEGFENLEPATMITIDAKKTINRHRYWEVSQNHEIKMSDESQVIAKLEVLLKDAVKRRMVSDVELGAFLSGGIDSSTVVALMQTQSDKPVQSFSIGFDDQDYNEAKHAKAVASHLGTNHTELYAQPEDALTLVDQLANHYDEPFADSSQIPTLLVSSLTRKQVTVALSGDGGDELFAGYNRYLVAEKIKLLFRVLPKNVRLGLARCIADTQPKHWDRVFKMVPSRFRPRLAGDKMLKLSRALACEDFSTLYSQLVTGWCTNDLLLGYEVRDLQQFRLDINRDDLIDQMQRFDIKSYLPDDILTKVDRASMAYSLETRVPLLDHRVVELAFRIPLHFKIKNGQSKWVLRQILYQYVPKSLIERPKMGFAIPLDSWLRGPLRDWAEELLDEKKIKNDQIFDSAKVRNLWNQHLRRERNFASQLWTILMFQLWKYRWLG